MAARIKIDAAAMPPFKVGTDPRNDWIKWKKALDRFLQANKIDDDEEKCNLLLVLGGIDLQSYYDKVAKWEVHKTVDEGDEIVVLKYESAILSLDEYFAPQLRRRFERHLLRSMRQNNQEPFEEYVFRLREQANRCSFIDADDMIVDQIIEGCRSADLRKKLLTDELSLIEVVNLGKTLEEVQKQTREYEKPSTSFDDGSLVQKVVGKTSFGTRSWESSRKCYNCNRPGHVAKDTDKCPAKNVECYGCRTKGHFKVCCRKRKHSEPLNRNSAGVKRIHAIMQSSDETETEKGIFFVKASEDLNEILELDVGGVITRMVIDSGSPANIIDDKTFKRLKSQGARILNERKPESGEMEFKAFASNRDIFFSAVFETEVKIPGDETGIWSHVLVAPEGQVSLLSKGTAFALGILKIGYHVNKISPGHHSMDTEEGRKEFPKIPDVRLSIQVDETVTPVVQAARRFPMSMEADVEQTIQELLEKQIIERAEASITWVSPLVPVRKSDGRIRLCVDMRAANRAVKRENYPMPNIDDAMSRIKKVVKLSKIDLEAAYYHFELKPDSRNITTFVARSGVYRFCRLMFGIKSAPELFQREMENLFRGIKGLIVYMDDLLIHGETVEEHDQSLQEVLDRIKKMNMKINVQKSVFGVTSVTFLGHIVSIDGIRPTDDKIKAILELQAPSSVSELRSLLGLINFVGKFIPNLSTMTVHMRTLLNKECTFDWTETHTRELEALKAMIGRVDYLGFFDPKDETRLVTDASPYGLGAVLIQIKDGVPRTISCISKSLADFEKKYCQTEKECYAIIWAMEKLYVYLYGMHFTLITDCKPLEYLFNRVKSKPSARIERWILRLQSFDFTVRYEPGDGNLADPLSRLSQGLKDYSTGSDVIGWLADEIKPNVLSIEELEKETLCDDDLQKVKEAIYTGVWDEVPSEYRTATVKDDLTLYGELILRGDRIIIPKQLREKVILLAHLGHQGGTPMKAMLRSKVWFPFMDRQVDAIIRNCKPCKMTALPDKHNPMIRRLPTMPWQDLAIDFKEGLPGDVSLLVVVCYTTRFVQIEPMKPATTQKVIGALLRMFSSFGIPRSITSDNGPQFKAIEFRNFCVSYGIHLNLSTPYWPEQNGAVERQMRNIGKRIKISCIQETDWKADIYEYLTLYHSTPQETTGVSPGQMMFGREIRNRIPSIHQAPSLKWESSRDRDMEKKEQHKTRADEVRQAKNHKLEKGDVVLMRNLRIGSYQPNFGSDEFEVMNIKGGEITVRSKETGKTYKRNSSHLKKLRDAATTSMEIATTGSELEGVEDAGEDVIQCGSTATVETPQKRVCRRPTKFDDFIV